MSQRPTLLRLLAGVLVALVLAACGSDDGTGVRNVGSEDPSGSGSSSGVGSGSEAEESEASSSGAAETEPSES